MGAVGLIVEMNVWVGPVVHKSILRFYMCWLGSGFNLDFRLI